jgi:hypothetical protein
MVISGFNSIKSNNNFNNKINPLRISANSPEAKQNIWGA